MATKKMPTADKVAVAVRPLTEAEARQRFMRRHVLPLHSRLTSEAQHAPVPFQRIGTG